ncbi:hypothetical protein HD806DRAFT_495723 [Xylariaceae sp. AK1471]|nr:hypothetical protein HD806DRAFT_495723 [Xylariaceae sp. AK1471]
MPKYDYVTISTSNRPQFGRSQSFSHHHHHPRHHIRPRCPDNCACVSTEDWTTLVERERSTRSANETLTRDNRTLKSDLRASHQENRALQDCNRGLQDELDQLRRHHSRDEDIVTRFRRRMAALKAEVDSKDHALHELQKEKDLADIRVRELSQTVSNQVAEITQLEDDNSVLSRVHKKDQHDLGVRTEEAREAWSLVSDLRRQLRKYHNPLPLRHRYAFA